MRYLFTTALVAILLSSPPAVANPDGDEEALATFMRAHLRTLAACYQTDDGASKATLTLEVQTSGEVSQVGVEPAEHPGWASCVTRRIRGWKFPSFGGEAKQVKWPLLYLQPSK